MKEIRRVNPMDTVKRKPWIYSQSHCTEPVNVVKGKRAIFARVYLIGPETPICSYFNPISYNKINWNYIPYSIQ